MSSLTVSVIQSDLYWEAPDANRAAFEEKIYGLVGSDLIVLPEMFTTGFTMNPALAEPMNLFTTKWMKQMATLSNAVILGSVPITEGGKRFNRAIWMRPNGTFETYDKRHLFRMGNENEVYTAGQKQLIVELNGWKIAVFTCYDLRFPVWVRNKNLAYDLAIFVANWPAARNHVWQTLLKARALENQAFCIGANRVGVDGNGVPHDGLSAIIDFKGNAIAEASTEEVILTKTLIKSDLDSFRTKFPAYLDADDFEILY
jgi:omega-amidase